MRFPVVSDIATAAFAWLSSCRSRSKTGKLADLKAVRGSTASLEGSKKRVPLGDSKVAIDLRNQKILAETPDKLPEGSNPPENRGETSKIRIVDLKPI
jgi:hypothetical protein